MFYVLLQCNNTSTFHEAFAVHGEKDLIEIANFDSKNYQDKMVH